MRTRIPALALAASIVASVISVTAVPTSAEPTTDPGDAASGWLVSQLTDGTHMEVDFGGTFYPDQGLTADVVFALAASGASEDAAAAATGWLEDSENYEPYIGDGVTESYVGATAKLALLAQVRGLDATSFGEDDTDLIARLTALENGDGRFVDQSSFGDFANVFGQSFAIITLTRQPLVDPSSDSLDLLLESQCDDGGFDDSLEPATCTSQIDATAMATQALLAGGRTTETADALDYLEGATQTESNSAGLTAQALRAGGRDDAADDVAAFVIALQIGCDGDAADRGAVAYDDTGLDGRAPRATAQAVLGLAGVDYLAMTSDGASTDVPSLDCTVIEEPTDPDDPDDPVLPRADPAVPVPANPDTTG